MTAPGGRWLDVRLQDGRVRRDWIPDEQPPGPHGGPGVWHIVTDVQGQQGRWEWHPAGTAQPIYAAPLPPPGGPGGFGPPSQAPFGGWRPPPPSAQPGGAGSGKKAWLKFRALPRAAQAAAVVGLVVIFGGLAAIGATAEDTTSVAQSSSKATPASTPAKTTNKFGVEGAVAPKDLATGELTIRFPISSSLTAGLMRDRAARDVFTMLEAVRGRSFKTVHIVGTIETEDKYGQVHPGTEVMWVTFTKATVLRLNTANLDRGSLSTLERLSCNFGMHPAMGYELHNTEDGPCYTDGHNPFRS